MKIENIFKCIVIETNMNKYWNIFKVLRKYNHKLHG
jgi:hypothetical protein